MSDPVIRLTHVPNPVPTNAAGEVTEAHIAQGNHWVVPNTSHHGEFTLCGDTIDYTTFMGLADGAPPCQECERMDG